MTGHKKGVRAELFKSIVSLCGSSIDNMTFVHCLCHRMNLCISSACSTTSMKFINSICNFIQRNEQMIQIRNYMKSHKYHYPPKPSQTRWNYYGNLLNYISEHYYIIVNYINTKLFKEFNNYMKSIYVIDENYFIKLTQPEYYANLVGISCIMNEANEVIRILQSPSIFIHQAYDLILKHIRNMFLAHSGACS